MNNRETDRILYPSDIEFIKSLMLKLEDDPKVQRYIELKNLLDNQQTIKSMNSIKSKKNNLLVSMGIYNYMECLKLNTFINKGYSDYCLYKNIKTEKICFVKIDDKYEFEDNNNIYYLNMDGQLDGLTKINYEIAFKNLQYQYYEYLSKYTEEEAINKMLKGNKRVK